MLRNDFNNLVLKELITLDSLKQLRDGGKNITSMITFGFQPRLSLRMVPNFFNRQLEQTTSNVNSRRRKRQNNQFNNNQFNNNDNNNQFNNNNQFANNNNQAGLENQSELNLYEQHEEIYGKKPNYEGPPISPKLPQDEVNLIIKLFYH